MDEGPGTLPVVFTEMAARMAKQSLADNGFPDAALRLSIVGGGCSGYQYQMQPLPLEEVKPTDTSLVFEDLTVVVDTMSLLLLTGTTVDYKTTLQSSGFVFINPNAKRKCGCGHSFS